MPSVAALLHQVVSLLVAIDGFVVTLKFLVDIADVVVAQSNSKFGLGFDVKF